MPQIHVLDAKTIDLIAAGEVVERPSSVVKELVENALDAGADAITVEIKDGGIGMIRVTDNGCGMSKDQVRSAFLRHATSKITNADDLDSVRSLGFRGEALSSIAAVSQVELITKTPESLTGVRLCLDGAMEKSFEEIGAPDGTTFLMRNLFFNTPVRRKFLKQAATEGGYVTDLMEHLALSRPDVSFRFIIGNQPRFHTSGNGNLKEVIYRIYGREIAGAVIPIQWEKNGMKLEGYLGKPTLVRSNRNYEIYFLNGRFIKSTIIAKALEEGYKEYLMQHKFPLSILHLSLAPELVDVNVHPTKMDVRLWDNFAFSDFVATGVRETLKNREMIPQDRLMDQRELDRDARKERDTLFGTATPEQFEDKRRQAFALMEEQAYQQPAAAEMTFEKSPVWSRVREITSKEGTQSLSGNGTMDAMKTTGAGAAEKRSPQGEDDFFVETHEREELPAAEDLELKRFAQQSPEPAQGQATEKTAEQAPGQAEGPKTLGEALGETVIPKQLDLFGEKILTRKNRDYYKIIGQVFDTYWMFEYEQKLCILDQHAAHEKIKYERFMKRYREKEKLSQTLFPPVVVTLTGQEELVLHEYQDVFARMGFEVESFGGNEYCLRSVPVDLYGCSEKEMFLAVLDELETGISRQNPRLVEEKIATMSCKAAVKGNTRLSYEEADRLIDELLTLENPYNCPHGRPTIITISKYEMEKKFKRIV